MNTSSLNCSGPRQKSAFPFLAALLLGCSFLLQAAQIAPSSSRTVIIPVANMYSGSTQDADVVSQAIFGSNVEILEVRGEWLHVQTADQYTGWMRAGDLLRLQNTGGYASSGTTAQVESLFASLYRETDITKHQPIITVPFETRLEVIAEGTGDDSNWLRIRLPDQHEAWIQKGDVNLHPDILSIPESIALAKRFLGIPYLWGGRSSFGFDCSGFTQMLVRSRGIIMPRDADLQAAWSGAIPVDRKDLQPGDLLFFGSGPNNITHTAMYIGDGQLIHDTTHEHPVIQISRLDDQPWTRILVACRRVK